MIDQQKQLSKIRWLKKDLLLPNANHDFTKGKNDVNYICFTCQVIRFNKQFYSRMFHSILVQDIYNQFYLSLLEL